MFEVGETDGDIFVARELLEREPRSARIGRGPAALAAVVRRRYSPARLDGEVVPVNMTVFVNFTLER